MHQFLLIISALSVLLAGCGVPVDLTPPEETTGYRGVVKLYGAGGGLCTGTFVSRHAILTAYHCLLHVSTVNVAIDGATYTAKLLDHKGAGDYADEFDLAILQLEQESPLTDEDTYPLAATISPGEVVRMVGFGTTGKDLFPKKRTGTNKVTKVQPYIEIETPTSRLTALEFPVSIRGGLTQIAGSKGDSGGPVLKMVGTRWHLAGVVHAASEGNSITTRFANLTRPEALSFIRDVNARHTLSIP